MSVIRTRRSDFSIPMTLAIGWWPNTFWVPTHSVIVPSSWGSARALLVSMGTAARRWLWKPAETTTSASAKRSSARSPVLSTTTLLPTSGNSTGAPSAVAAATSATASSGSMSAQTRSAASAAARSDSATTMATISPTKRTRSLAIGGRAVSRGQYGPCRIIPSSRSSAVKTATTPGAARASSVSIERMSPWGT